MPNIGVEGGGRGGLHFMPNRSLKIRENGGLIPSKWGSREGTEYRGKERAGFCSQARLD